MKRIGIIVWAVAAGLVLSCSARIVSAGVADTVREDMRAVSGYVLTEQEGGYLVDLDARHGLRVGDLLSVVTRGREVLHPVTKEVIGRLDEAKAVLQVTQMKSGFSVARRVSGAGDIVPGDIVRRFALVTAVFQGTEERSRALYEELRVALPELEWQGLFSAGERSGNMPKTDLVFTLEGNELRLLDREGQPLRTWAYPVAEEPVPRQPAAVAAPQPARPGAGLSMPAPVPAPAGKDRSPVLWTTGATDFGPFRNLGELPDRVLMAAFARDADRLLLATVDDEYLRVYGIDGGLKQLAVQSIRGTALSPLAVAWWRPDKDGSLYLAVTAGEEVTRNIGRVVETRLSSAIYEFSGQAMRPVAADLPYFLGTSDRDGDGLPETLLGQELSLDSGFGRTFVLRNEGGKIRAGDPDITLPREFSVPGSIVGDLTGDGKVETAFVRNSVLWIYEGMKRIYKSSSDMGGSASTLTYDLNPGAQDTMFTVLSVEIPPFRGDIDGDGVAELLVVASEKGIMKLPGVGASIKKSWVSVLKYEGGTFRKGRLPGELEDPIQGIYADGKQVYLVVTRTTSSLTKKGSSSLLVRPLDRPPG